MMFSVIGCRSLGPQESYLMSDYEAVCGDGGNIAGECVAGLSLTVAPPRGRGGGGGAS